MKLRRQESVLVCAILETSVWGNKLRVTGFLAFSLDILISYCTIDWNSGSSNVKYFWRLFICLLPPHTSSTTELRSRWCSLGFYTTLRTQSSMLVTLLHGLSHLTHVH